MYYVMCVCGCVCVCVWREDVAQIFREVYNYRLAVISPMNFMQYKTQIPTTPLCATGNVPAWCSFDIRYSMLNNKVPENNMWCNSDIFADIIRHTTQLHFMGMQGAYGWTKWRVTGLKMIFIIVAMATGVTTVVIIVTTWQFPVVCILAIESN